VTRTLYLLIGPKGSGKTHIGTLVAKVRFDWALEIDNDGPAPENGILEAIWGL